MKIRSRAQRQHCQYCSGVPHTSLTIQQQQLIILHCSSCRHSQGASKGIDSTDIADEDDVLAEILGILAGRSSHWYTLNGDLFAKISLCKMLGFYNESDYHSFVVSKKLAAYWLDKWSRSMKIEILLNKWKTYFQNSRYSLSIPANCEIVCKNVDLRNLLHGKNYDNSKRYDYCAIRLGRGCRRCTHKKCT